MKNNDRKSMHRLDGAGFVFFSLMGSLLLVSALSHGRIDQIFYAGACSCVALGFFIDRRRIEKRQEDENAH